MADLMPCPCCPATRCSMDEPCLGCETYGEWLNKLRARESEERDKARKQCRDRTIRMLNETGDFIRGV